MRFVANLLYYLVKIMENILLITGLFWTGFAIGLSGALLPGPLLAFTLKESLKYGIKTGLLVISGHIFVEIVVVIMIIAGLLKFLSSSIFMGTAGIAGAAVLFFMGVALLKQKDIQFDTVSEKTYGPAIGGIVLTVFNPGFPIWWGAVGYNMLREGLRIGGNTGLLSILCGHWLADLGWYTVVAVAVTLGKELILRRKVYPVIKLVMALFMFVLCVYLLISGIRSLI